MTKADAFDRAVRLIFKNNDFSLFDEIYHPDYSAPDPTTGITVNLEDEKLVLSTYSEDYILGLFRIVYESDDFLCVCTETILQTKDLIQFIMQSFLCSSTRTD